MPKMKISKDDIEDLNPYPNSVYHWIDRITHHMMRPWRYSMDAALSCLIPTTKEMQTFHWVLVRIMIVFPITFAISFIVLPLGILGMAVWIIICDKRTPYRISRCKLLPKPPTLKKTYSIGTANLCLLQECLSRYNNLTHTYQRADEIGQRISDQQMKEEVHVHTKANGSVKPLINNCRNGFRSYKTGLNGSSKLKRHPILCNGMDVGIKEGFPFLDFMFFQETWDTPCAQALAKHLHQVFPYIIYDVGENGFSKNKFFNNSALMLASRYPIMDVSFRRYTDTCRQCSLASKGLLQVKVACYEMKLFNILHVCRCKEKILTKYLKHTSTI